MTLDQYLEILRTKIPRSVLLRQLIDPQIAGGYGEKSFSAAALMYYMLQQAGGRLEGVPTERLQELAILDELEGLDGMDDYWTRIYGAVKAEEISAALSDLRRLSKTIFPYDPAGTVSKEIVKANRYTFIRTFIESYAKKGLKLLGREPQLQQPQLAQQQTSLPYGVHLPGQ